MDTFTEVAPEVDYYMALVFFQLGKQPEPDPAKTGLTPSTAKIVENVLRDCKPFDITGYPLTAIPEELTRELVYGAGDQVVRPRVVARGINGTGYDGLRLIERFKKTADGNLAGLGGMFPSMQQGGRLAAVYAVAILLRYLGLVAPAWIKPVYDFVDSGWPPDEEIALAYAGGAIAAEADAMKERRLRVLSGGLDEHYQAEVMRQVPAEALLAVTQRLGVPISPADLEAFKPDMWAHIIEHLFEQLHPRDNGQ